MQHFTYVAKSIPFTFKDTHPFNGIITGWFKFEDAYIAVTDETIQFDYFYCPICNRWDKNLKHEFYYISRHVKNCHMKDIHDQVMKKTKHIASIVDAQKDKTQNFSNSQMEFIRKQLHKYFLTTNKPLTDANNQYLKLLCPDLSSSTLRDAAVNVAKATKNEIKNILAHALFIRPSIDEWEDSQKRRYVGETIFCLVDGKWNNYVLALRHIKSMHATAAEIANILDQIDIDFNLDSTKERYCSDNCNTMLSVQTQKGIARFPCILHMIHNVIGAFLAGENSFVTNVTTLTSTLHASTIYESYCQTNKIAKIPQYTQIRWTSMTDTLQYIADYKDQINDFLNRENMNPIPELVINATQDNLTLFANLKKCIIALEGDDFGQISKVNTVITKMKEYINSMRSPLYDESKKRALDYIKVFENRFKNDIYPLIYVAEFVNPSLKLTLSPMELKQSISYIKSRARSLGYTFEDHSQNDKKDTDSVLDYTDELDANDIIRELTSSRKLQRGADSLLKFWLEKLGNQSTSGVAYVALEVLSTLCHSAST